MRTVIIGAGFAGLSAAHKLGKNYVVLEKENRPGGLCRTEEKDGFLFDYTGHLLHLRKPEIEKFIKKNVLVKLNKISRKSYIYSNGVYTEYPYQANNFGLPPEVVEENLTGFIRAKMAGEKNNGTFRDWVLKTFGEGIAKNFMFPYNSKLWNYPLDKLTLKWLGRFVPDPGIDEIMDGILPKGSKNVGYNAFFNYPEKGGIESVIKGLYEGVKKNVILNCEVKRVNLKKKIVYFNNDSVSYDRLISTMSLKHFLKITGEDKLKKMSGRLKATSVYSLNVGFKKKKGDVKHWVYIPEKNYPFYRIGFPDTFAAANAPKGCASVFTEVSFRGKVPENIDGKIVSSLIKMGIVGSKKDIVTKLKLILKDAYVIYDKERETTVAAAEKHLNKAGVYLAGRWGRWEYSSMEDAIIEGFEAAKMVNGKR